MNIWKILVIAVLTLVTFNVGTYLISLVFTNDFVYSLMSLIWFGFLILIFLIIIYSKPNDGVDYK